MSMFLTANYTTSNASLDAVPQVGYAMSNRENELHHAACFGYIYGSGEVP